jgi:hypothetical protein
MALDYLFRKNGLRDNSDDESVEGESIASVSEGLASFREDTDDSSKHDSKDGIDYSIAIKSERKS